MSMIAVVVTSIVHNWTIPSSRNVNLAIAGNSLKISIQIILEVWKRAIAV